MMRKSCKPKVINYHSCITNAIVFKRLIILKPLIFMFCKLSLDIVCTTTLELKSGEMKSNNKSFFPYFFLVQCRHPSKSCLTKVYNYNHSSEIAGLCLIEYPIEMLQHLLYFCSTKPS